MLGKRQVSKRSVSRLSGSAHPVVSVIPAADTDVECLVLGLSDLVSVTCFCDSGNVIATSDPVRRLRPVATCGMGQRLGSPPHQVGAATEQIASGPHRLGIDMGQREISSSHELGRSATRM